MVVHGSRRLTSDERWRLGPMTASEVLQLPAMVEFVDSGRALNLQRTQAYSLARRGEYPVPLHRRGCTWAVRRRDLLRELGIDDAAEAQVG